MKPLGNVKSRSVNLDIIRCVAVFSVVSIHFFLNNGFYKTKVVGEKMFLLVLGQTFFSVCVPLFMILTGYLMSRKTLSAGFYKGIVKTLGIYVLASIVCLLFKYLYLHQPITAKTAFFGILDFTGANYAWYIEMYIGLFLFIPFLNILYAGLRSQKQKLWLIATLIICTVLPTLLNNFDLVTEGWFRNPPMSKDYTELVPNWWDRVYPFTYYFIGAYLREYDIKIRKRTNLLLLGGSVLLFSVFNYYRSYRSTYDRGTFIQWGGFETLILTVLLFVLLNHLKTDRLPAWIKAGFAKISDISLGIYLISYVFDQIFYPFLLENVPKMTSRLPYYLVIVPCVFLFSAAVSSLLNIVYSGIEKLVIHCKKIICTRMVKKLSGSNG